MKMFLTGRIFLDLASNAAETEENQGDKHEVKPGTSPTECGTIIRNYSRPEGNSEA